MEVVMESKIVEEIECNKVEKVDVIYDNVDEVSGDIIEGAADDNVEEVSNDKTEEVAYNEIEEGAGDQVEDIADDHVEDVAGNQIEEVACNTVQEEGAGDYAEEGAGDYAEEGAGDYAEEGAGDYAEEGAGDYAEEGAGDYAEEGAGDYAEEGAGDYAEEGAGDYAEEGAGDYAQEGACDYAEEGAGDYAEEGAGDYAEDVAGNYLEEVVGDHIEEGAGDYAEDVACYQIEEGAAYMEPNGIGEDEMNDQREPIDSAIVPTVHNMKNLDAEEFLARVNMNDKIDNILRSPYNSQNGVRQRSVFTMVTPGLTTSGTRFNIAAPPFISQRSFINGNGVTSKDLPSVGGPCESVVPNQQLPYGLSVQTPSTHSFTNYDSTMMDPNANIGHNVYTDPFSFTTPVYDFENEACHMFPQPMPPPPFLVGRMNNTCHMDYENLSSSGGPGTGPLILSNGIIQVRLRNGVRIDMSLDRAIRVVNLRSMVAIALSRNCNTSALIHPNGRVLQSGTKVEIVTYDGMKTNNYVRYAKMWYKGVSFTSESCALIYLVDSAGTRTTTDTFTDLTKDHTLTVLYDESRHGPSYIEEANEIIQNSTYFCTEEGTEIYEINGFRITQAADGLVKILRIQNKCLLRTSPSNGSATLSTPGIHCTASLGKTSHLFVRRNEKRMHFDGACFIVRNAGHSAGFNENNLLIVY